MASGFQASMESQSLNHDMLASTLGVSAEWAMYANSHPEAGNAMNGSVVDMEEGWRGRPALRAYPTPEDIPALPGTERLTQATKDLMSLDNNPQKWSESVDREIPQAQSLTRSNSNRSAVPRPISQPLSSCASTFADPALSLRDKSSIASSITYPSVFNSLSPTSSSESSTRPGSSSATSPSISAYGTTTSPTAIFPSSDALLLAHHPHNQVPKRLTNGDNHAIHPIPNTLQPQPSSSATLLPDTRPNSSFDPRSIAPNPTPDVTMSGPTEQDEKQISKRKRPVRPTPDNSSKPAKDKNVSSSSVTVLRSIADAKHAPISAPTTTTSVITPSKPSLLSPSQKKANHIQSEQKRRANIRRGYEALCEVVPALREAIRGEESAKQAEAEGGAGGSDEAGGDTKKTRPKKKRRPNKRADDSEAGQDIGGLKLDGRAGPRSENVVLQKSTYSILSFKVNVTQCSIIIY